MTRHIHVGATSVTAVPHRASLRIATWNVRRATPTSGAWDCFTSPAVNPDIALLQEVGAKGLPVNISDEWAYATSVPVKKTGKDQAFRTMILVKKSLGASGLDDERTMGHSQPWIHDLLAHFKGNLLYRQIDLPLVGRLNLVSVYSPAWTIDSTGLVIGDTKDVKLTKNEWLWVTDLLRAALMELIDAGSTQHWVVGGDLNLSITFDEWRKGGRGNAEYLDRMRCLGLVEALASKHEELIPTFKNPRGGKIIHQMDHLFVSGDLARSLNTSWVGDRACVFDGGLSDHLPVVACFDLEQLSL
jgi:endonuclease/exonuclease/phosphatase family metal-dependent hydrolase